MPRKTASVIAAPSARRGRFNEAAARCRGKRDIFEVGICICSAASMRPRPDAAENVRPTASTGYTYRVLQ